MVGVHEIIGAGICAVGFAPIVVHSDEAAVVYNRKSIGLRHRDYVHHPHGL